MDVRVILAAMVALVANGKIEEDLLTAALIRQYKRIVAVDGGLSHCIRMGIEPDLYIGDGDSFDPGLLNIPHQLFSKDKDESDLELAVKREIAAGAKKIVVFGALGSRADHALANLFLLSRYPEVVSMETEQEIIKILPRDCVLDTFPGQTLSLMPLAGPVSGVETSGLKWEIKGKTLNRAFFSLSNRAVDSSVSISHKEGLLLCSLLKNKEP